MRCSRVPLSDDSLDSKELMQIFFLDTGETFLQKIIDIPDNSFYEMPEALMKVSPRAIKCKWKEVHLDHQFLSDGAFIANNIFSKLNFEVVEELPLVVNIKSHYDHSPLKTLSNLESSVSETVLESTDASKTNNKDMFTVKELEILNEEPLNTENPLLAVQGFITRDDNRLCKFYDPNIGGCFKGGRCRQRHRLEIKDGTCRDAIKTDYLNIPKVLPVPAVYTQVRIEITHFYSINRFLCRYKKLKPSKSDMDLNSLLDFINDEEKIKTYTPIKFNPTWNQLVMYKANDGKFYRARIESCFDEDMNVDLVLVDLGTVESASQDRIFNWCNEFNSVAFQSVEMEIVNIQSIQDDAKDLEGVKIIIDYQKEGKNTLKADVFNNVCGIKVVLLNKNDDDIGEELVGRKLALKKKMQPPMTGFVIPG